MSASQSRAHSAGLTRVRWRRAIIAGALALVLILARGAGRTLIVAGDESRPQALLALGSHEWERLPAIADLAFRFPDALVLLTEPAVPTESNCHRCAERVSWLTALGVERDRLHLLPDRVTNTHDEATAAFNFCRQRSIASLTVLTSPYHTRRALATFLAVFDDSIAVSVQPASHYSPASPDRWWLQPYDRAYVAYEWAAIVWYLARYQVDPFVSRASPPGLATTVGTVGRAQVHPREVAHG